MSKKYKNNNTKPQQEVNETKAVKEENTEKTAAAKKEKRMLLYPKTGGGLAACIISLLAIPYAMIWVLGFIFDQWLRWYFMTVPIFIFVVALLAVNIVLLVLCCIHFKKRNTPGYGIKKDKKKK